MAKGSPDPQHQLISTALTCCLRQTCPQASITCGTLISDLGLKPDIFVAHPDGRRWAYEIINKNRAATKLIEKHQHYLEAGVSVYWVLWETLAPEKPLDGEKIARQAYWYSEALAEEPRRYKLNKLQRTLAELGEGWMYAFSVYKPLFDQVDHWMLKLMMISLDTYCFSPDQLKSDRVISKSDFLPLPYLTFAEDGRPALKPGMDELSSFLAPIAESAVQFPTDHPIFINNFLGKFDNLLDSPDTLQELVSKAFLQELIELTPHYSEAEWTLLAEQLQVYKEKVSQKTGAFQTETVEQVFEALNVLTADLPPVLQAVIQKFYPALNAKAIHQIIALKQWYEEDPHLQALLTKL